MNTCLCAGCAALWHAAWDCEEDDEVGSDLGMLSPRLGPPSPQGSQSWPVDAPASNAS